MTIKRFLFILAALALVAGPAWGQTVHYNDDRDLFMGVANTTSILPNIMILADNSGSMNTAIYHPAYVQGTNYKVDDQGHNLNLSESLPNMTDWSQNDSSIRYLSAITNFKICRGVPHYSYTWDARGTYDSRVTNPLRWKVYKDTLLTPSGTQYTPVNNQIIDYRVYNNVVGAKAKIINVTQGRDTGGARRYYWYLEMDLVTNVGPPPPNGNPPTGNRTIYFNFQRTLDSTDNTTAEFVPDTTSCTGYESSIDAALYGGTESGYQTRYDEQYLYWLAFHASDAEIAEVRTWALSADGIFPDGIGGTYTAGHFRMKVMRDVLKDIAVEFYGDDKANPPIPATVRMGLAAFDDNDDGGRIIEVLNNASSGGTLNAFTGFIDALRGENNTPLAEALTDVWEYYKGTNNYYPNDLPPNNGGNIASNIPIEHWCQQNYVIMMTDGQSTQDLFIDNPAGNQFRDSYFATNPVKRTTVSGVETGWGDYDDHDPASHTNPDGSTYCPLDTCWMTNSNGTDYLDDVAYYLAHSDLYPDAYYGVVGAKPYMPSQQAVRTYVIGFNMDNQMLAETAKNGDGEYYTANSYDNLRTALVNAITSIRLRSMAFAAFTAPKKITSTVGEGFSFVGYFMPSVANPIWEGHLQSYKMTDKWFADLDSDGQLESDNNGSEPGGVDEFVNPYDYESPCEKAPANVGLNCLRSLELATKAGWDTAQKLYDSTTARRIFTNDGSDTTLPYALINFTATNAAALQSSLNAATEAEAASIITTIGGKTLGDLFHSDIAYVGSPMPGKAYSRNLNPVECGTTASVLKEDDSRCFENLLKSQAGRAKVVYAGSNDGILHQVDAVNGEERWGFIPDEVLPSLKNIVIDRKYTYTVDGRLAADDIYYYGATENTWKTLLVFGLKDGGNSFYALDITNADADPTLLWKFKDDVYSGKSWSKPFFGKIRHLQTDGSWIDRWVVVLAGGMAFNNENKSDYAGKAVFVVDASSGELLWSIGYKPTGVTNPGVADDAGTPAIETVIDGSVTTGLRYLTAKDEMNYPIPSAVTAVDRDADGYLDTIYFGNVAGHLFKIDMASNDPSQWKTYQLFKKTIAHQATATTTAVAGGVITIPKNANFILHMNVFGLTSKAMGTIDAVDTVGNDTNLTVTTISPSSFVAGENIVVPDFTPIFLSPAIFYDKCANLWVAFGTGDRIRSRTNPDSGKFLALRDGKTTLSGSTVQKTDILLSDLVTLTWVYNSTTKNWGLPDTNIKVTGKWGWQFTFPMSANHEKLFDPDPFVLPDKDLVPHIYFNSYQPTPLTSLDPCEAPENGIMFVYELTSNYCGDGSMGGTTEDGRIAGGGMFGTDYVNFIGDGNVASIPPLKDIKAIKLFFTGSMLFMKERKR